MLTNCLNLTDVLLYHFQFSHAFYELVARQRYRLNLKGSGSICCTRLANCNICDMFHPQPLWRLSAAMDIQNLWHYPQHCIQDPIVSLTESLKIKCLLGNFFTHTVTFGICRWPRRHQTASRVWYGSKETRRCSEAERDVGPSDRINLHVKTSWAVLGCIEINRGDVFNILNIDMRWMDTGVIAQPHALNAAFHFNIHALTVRKMGPLTKSQAKVAPHFMGQQWVYFWPTHWSIFLYNTFL